MFLRKYGFFKRNTVCIFVCLALLTCTACSDDDAETDSQSNSSSGSQSSSSQSSSSSESQSSSSQSSIAVTNVVLNITNADVYPGESLQLTATVLPDDATDKSVSWSSSNTNAVSVDNSGLLTAIADGMSQILVTTEDGGLTAVCLVTVPDQGPEVGSFDNNGTFETNRGWFHSCIYDGYLYVSGGSYSGELIRSIEFASVASNGSCSSFADTTSLPKGRAYHGCIGYKGYLYIISGREATNAENSAGEMTNTVLYAPINGDGSLGTFQTASGRLNTARGGFGFAIYNDMLYVMGGTIGGHGTSSVEYASIQANGDIGSFTEMTASDDLNEGRSFCAGAQHSGYLYVAGGRDTGSTSHTTVEYARIQADGSPTAFSVAAAEMDRPRENFDIAAYNGYLFMVGGYDAAVSDGTNSIEYALLDPATGEPGTFQYTTNTPPRSEVWHHSAAAYRNRLFIINCGYGGPSTVYSAFFLE